MTLHLRLLIGSAIVLCLAHEVEAQVAAPETIERIVEVDGHSMRAVVSGLGERTAGRPVIVFEAGATTSLDVWAGVLPLVTPLAPVVAYDRAGLGRSAWDEVTPTPRHVASRLRSLLRQLGADPPYLLVGWSWGGSLARYFAGYLPTEVVGVVFVDPGPIVTQSLADELAPFDSVGAGRSGYDAFWSAYARLLARAPAVVRAEFEVYRSLMQLEPAQRDLPEMPGVPVVVLVAAKPYPPLPELPFDPQAHFEADLRHRIRMLQEWALASPRGTLVVTNHTTHAIPREDPELVAWAVRRVLSSLSSSQR